MSAVPSPLVVSENSGAEHAHVSSTRYDSIDLVRGVVMVVMVLDHVRDFFGNAQLDPTNLAKATAGLFLTRWVTHFCAPTFVFLAGVSAYLYGTRVKSRGELATFLLSRGLWLVFLELTVIRFGLTLDPFYQFVPLTVIWAIGISMIILAGLVYLPTTVVGLIGVVMIIVHNLFDNVHPGYTGVLAGLGTILHQPGLLVVIAGRPIFAFYSLIPWVGVMAAGYGLGAIFPRERAQRRAVLFVLGVAMIAVFLGLRAWNHYGDPRPWTTQTTSLFTAFSFINCTKYPPSLLYLLMTLGPMILLLAIIDGNVGRIGRFFVTLGRVPLFYYILQWYMLQALSVLLAAARGIPLEKVLGHGPFDLPAECALGLPAVYVIWFVCVGLLYFPCVWFAGVKKRHKDKWLSYL